MSLVIAETAGGPRRRGRAQGEASADQIAAAVTFYEQLADATGVDLGVVGKESLTLLEGARGLAPQTIEELEGVAEGSGTSRETIAILNCMEEAWPSSSESCTTMISGPFLLHAEQWYAGHSQVTVVIAKPDHGPAFVSPTCAGFLPAVGMSASGFAQGIDSLSAPDDRFGIPRLIVSRLGLGARDIEAAIGAACIEGRAGGYAHVLATTHRQLVVETSATTATVLNRVTAHTNHYLGSSAPAEAASAGSMTRLERAEELLRRNPPDALEDCCELLADHHGTPQSICVHEDGIEGSGTVFGMACDLRKGRVIVSDGSPCSGRWEEFAVPSYQGAVGVV
jgi:isopenicillin-N N-acyltransferase-like protein